MSVTLKSESQRRKSFRRELEKVMPGLKWTIHRGFSGGYKDTESDSGQLVATATRGSGKNRLFTLTVSLHWESDGRVFYSASSSGYGTRAPWLGSCDDKTVARALRGLQTDYERKASEFSYQARYLREARTVTNQATG